MTSDILLIFSSKQIMATSVLSFLSHADFLLIINRHYILSLNFGQPWAAFFSRRYAYSLSSFRCRYHKVYQKVRWNSTKKTDVSRVLPLPQWFQATEKSTRNVTYKWKSKQSLTLHARADFEKFIRSRTVGILRFIKYPDWNKQFIKYIKLRSKENLKGCFSLLLKHFRPPKGKKKTIQLSNISRFFWSKQILNRVKPPTIHYFQKNLVLLLNTNSQKKCINKSRIEMFVFFFFAVRIVAFDRLNYTTS